MKSADEIVRALAQRDPPTHTDGDGIHCGLCQALLEGAFDNDTEHHEPGCPWRMAVEYDAPPPFDPGPRPRLDGTPPRYRLEDLPRSDTSDASRDYLSRRRR